MNKNIFSLTFLLFAATILFSQNENNPTDSTQSKAPDTLSHAPQKEEKVRDFQFTFLTPIGTNGTDAGKITNKFSVNVLAGVNGGLDGVELGAFANIITGKAIGMQIAGFSNVVLGDFDGSQIAGFANTNIQTTKGLQLAGFANTSLKGSEGMQIAGFANITNGNSQGVQLSGFLNFAGNFDGLQVGFVNIADTLDGLQIGFFSYARNGYHHLEASSNETFQANIAFKTGGNRYFYNIFAAGARWSNNDTHWGFGYGIGTNFKISKRMNANIDAISYGIIPQNAEFNDDWDSDDIGAVGKLNLGISYRIAKNFTIFGGPTFNILYNQNRDLINSINPNQILTASIDNEDIILYPGFNVGIRI